MLPDVAGRSYEAADIWVPSSRPLLPAGPLAYLGGDTEKRLLHEGARIGGRQPGRRRDARRRSPGHGRVGRAGGEGGHVAEDQVARAEAAGVALLLLATDDREGAEDIIGRFAIESE